MLFSRIPERVEATRWEGQEFKDDPFLIMASEVDKKIELIIDNTVRVWTREGCLHAELGDMIVKDKYGDYYPWKFEAFCRRYDPVK